MEMFEDLDWKSAFRRAAFAALLYLLFVYVMSTAFPESFGAGTNLVSALVVTLIFFLLYAPIFAFAERRKRRRLAEMRDQKKGKSGAKTSGKSGAAEEEEAEVGSLRGRHNPNTSRKKAARRRR
jgi:membrane protein implicated in regulation of membrane protease activity